MMNKFHFVTPMWGEDFINAYDKVILPAHILLITYIQLLKMRNYLSLNIIFRNLMI